jgi:hypothetical protein
MKAISIRQPWAWLIVQGIKPIENRTWFTGYRGPLLIHASKTWDEQGEKWIWSRIYSRWSLPLRTLPHRDDPRIHYGALIGRVDLVDCILKPRISRRSANFSSPWFTGPYGLIFQNAVEFQVPIPYRGQLDLFEIPDYAEKRIQTSQESQP